MSYSRLVCVVAAAAAVVTGSLTVARADGPPTDEVGWTDLTPPAGALVFYVSSSSGSDSNPGSQAAPFRSLARGYSALRDGQPDQLLLKAGDTWNESFPSTFNKGSGSNTTYMVLGSYGTGARPKLRVSSPAVYGGNAGKRGLAVVGLDMAPNAPGSGYAAITFFQPWSHVLVEDCSVVGFPVNIVCQETGSGRLNDIKIRRSIVADSNETGSGHSQGIFLGSCDNWVIEGCVIDNNARNKADMFCHNVYIHETNGPGIFRDNISSRACSHGVQQRPGGTMENCLFLQNPINAYQGGAGANIFRNNVALDGRDINSVDRRGVGFDLAGGAGSIVEYNIAAHQKTGTNPVAFDFAGWSGSSIKGNCVWDWSDPTRAGWNAAFQFDSGSGSVAITGNKLNMPNVGMLIRCEGRGISGMNLSGNTYWTATPDSGAGGYSRFSTSAGVGVTLNGWRSATGDNSTFLPSAPALTDVSIAAYMASIGLSGDLPEFLAQARLQSRQNWRDQFTTNGANTWVRSRLAMGGSTPVCYVNCDGSTAAPVVNANDFQCFVTKYAAGDPWANCDGSTVPPVLTANDFQCFLSRFAVGCP